MMFKIRVPRHPFKATARVVLGLAAGFVALAAVTGARYGVSVRAAASGLVRHGALAAVEAAVWVYDPCRPTSARLGPDAGTRDRAGDRPRLDDVLPPGEVVTIPSGRRVKALAADNARIVRSPHGFGYQPCDDPRLRELRARYRLDEVVAPAWSEFEAMVLLRSWSRSLFRRNDDYPMMENFNALDLLEKAEETGRFKTAVPTGQGPRAKLVMREPARPRSAEDYDPCHLFPLLYAQVLLSMGYQARVVSVGHAVVEVWSNQFGKWAVMDAELDHHFERDGVPLNAVELLDAHHDGGDRVRLVRGMRFPMPENPTMVHLKAESLDALSTLRWFNCPIELVDLRNDWLTNHYFPGHPRRSERNSLVYVDPRVKVDGPVAFRNRMRPHARSKAEMYWTLNQTEIRLGCWAGGQPELWFDTVTPNFAGFEVVVDGRDFFYIDKRSFLWELHEGANTLVVRAVNRFGVPGVESSVRLAVFPGSVGQGS